MKTAAIAMKCCTTYETENHKIWHIHGSQSRPGSITLGYEHYGGYLQKMRNYVTSFTVGLSPLSRRIKADAVNYESWMDFFFTHDIYILGLNLDFVEMHLWWLLTYRARILVHGKLPITNKIVYYYPEAYHFGSINKLELFKANGVEVVALKQKEGSRMNYYLDVVEEVRRHGNQSLHF